MTDESTTYTIDGHGRRHLISAMLTHYAKGLMHPNAVLPDSVLLHTHDLTADQLLSVADYYALPITVMSNSAVVTREMSTPGIDFRIEQNLFSSDLSAEAREYYDLHNKECLAAPDADPVATQPEPGTAGYL